MTDPKPLTSEEIAELIRSVESADFTGVYRFNVSFWQESAIRLASALAQAVRERDEAQARVGMLEGPTIGTLLTERDRWDAFERLIAPEAGRVAGYEGETATISRSQRDRILALAAPTPPQPSADGVAQLIARANRWMEEGKIGDFPDLIRDLRDAIARQDAALRELEERNETNLRAWQLVCVERDALRAKLAKADEVVRWASGNCDVACLYTPELRDALVAYREETP